VVVDTVVVVSLLVSTGGMKGEWTYVQEESSLTTVEGSCDVSFVDVGSVYLSVMSHCFTSRDRLRLEETYRQKSKPLGLDYYNS
jgi:hypothetical protein